MKSRLPLPDVHALDHEQQQIYDSILSTRGNLSGPFLAWMHSPKLASHAEKLGAFCRYQTALELIESEILILIVAAHFHCVGEQQIHEPIATSAGVSDDNIARLRQRLTPNFATSRQTLLHDLARELLQTNRINPALYEQGIAEFGTGGMVELVSIIGYYILVAVTLNAFEMTMA